MTQDAQFPWPTLPLAEIAAEMCLGKMLDKAKNRGTLQPYLRNVNVRWLTFDFSDMKEMRFEDSEGERFQLRANDLVICEGGEPGRCAVWTGAVAPIPEFTLQLQVFWFLAVGNSPLSGVAERVGTLHTLAPKLC